VNLVADEGVDAPIVQRLRADGHTVWYIAELSPSIPDEKVLALAVRHKAVLLTADKDFGALVFQQGFASAGVIPLRLAGLSGDEKARVVGQMVAAHDEELDAAFTVITPRRVRIRK
jgi:predicted nuclease of predicted toxin-antitoxin system